MELLEPKEKQRVFVQIHCTYVNCGDRSKFVLISCYHVYLFSYIDHFYSGGDVCDLTGKPRHVLVRLKYVKNNLVKNQ